MYSNTYMTFIRTELANFFLVTLNVFQIEFYKNYTCQRCVRVIKYIFQGEIWGKICWKKFVYFRIKSLKDKNNVYKLLIILFSHTIYRQNIHFNCNCQYFLTNYEKKTMNIFFLNKVLINNSHKNVVLILMRFLFSFISV